MKPHPICSFLLSLVVLFLLAGSAEAQTISTGNAWYKANPDQPYVKIKVTEDGVYRVTRTEIENLGYDLNGVQARFLHLYYRGKEIPIYVSAESDGRLRSFAFYGQKNDGLLDSLLYRHIDTGLLDPDAQMTRRSSLFTDTSAYFLTWNNVPGRRYFTFTDIVYSRLTPESAFSYEAAADYQFDGDPRYGANYSFGAGNQYDPFRVLNSDYIVGEGYISGVSFDLNAPFTLNIPTPDPANLGSPTEFGLRVYARSVSGHHHRISLNGNDADTLVDFRSETQRPFIKTYRRTRVRSLTNTTSLTFRALYSQGNNAVDKNHLSWVTIRYDRRPDWRGASEMPISAWNKNDDTYFRFDNVDGNDSIFVFDLADGVVSRGVITSNGQARVIVKSLRQNGSRDLHAVTDRGFKRAIVSRPSLNKLHDPTRGAEFVIIAHRSLQSSAEAYRNYRDTAQVHPLSARVVYVDEIYDEYGYGSITTWAIKRFCLDALQSWQVKPKYVLFWGKGQTKTRSDAPDNLVPTYGYPASDFEFVSNFELDQVDYVPQVSVGRFNAYNDRHGFDYLDKVREYESTPWDVWMKRGVFLGGGATAGEQTDIAAGLAQMRATFRGIPFGGIDISFQKTSVQAEDPGARYHDEISEGVSLVHFFGHSSNNIQDISIKEPEQYENYGRYPFMIAMGCYGGDFSGRESFGERWIRAPERGCIGYFANSSAGYLPPLRSFGKDYYPFMYDNMLGDPVGEVIRAHFSQFLDKYGGKNHTNHVRQMNLQGDPSIRLYHPKKPDLAIDRSSIFLTPDNLSAQSDSFTVNVVVRNLGLVTTDSFMLEIEHVTPDRSIAVPIRRRFPMMRNVDTLQVNFQNVAGPRLAGDNSFRVFVDVEEKIEELSEENNQVFYTQLVPGNVPATLYPPEFAVIGTPQTYLAASTFFVSDEEGVQYQFEIDTVHDFSSGFRATSPVITGTANYAEWDLPFPLTENQVYFWRVRLLGSEPILWSESSFKFIAGKDGWAQNRPAQFTRNLHERLTVDPKEGFTFDRFMTDYEYRINYDSSRNFFNVTTASNGAISSDFIISRSTQIVFYTVIDRNTLEVKGGIRPFQIGTAVYNSDLRAILNPPVGIDSLERAIQRANPGDYVLVIGMGNANHSQWPTSTLSALGQIGISSDFRTHPDDQPFMLFGRKGGTSADAIEVYQPNVGSSRWAVEPRLSAPFAEGESRSVQLGPALAWGTVEWNFGGVDAPGSDRLTTDVYGIRRDFSDTLLRENIDPNRPLSLADISAQKFPYLRLEAQFADSAERTAPQLGLWQVLYEPVPEAAIDLSTLFRFDRDTVQQGEVVSFALSARNISSRDMDSLLVHITTIDEDRVRKRIDSLRLAPLPAGATLPIERSFNTLEHQLSGDMLLEVEINPNFDQPEQYSFNNRYLHNFRVEPDRRNPLLDVTFDGKHIMDGDIVSPRPEIHIQLNDENPFIPISDTTSMRLWLKRDDNMGADWEEIFVGSDGRVEWQPAQLPDNKAEARFFPGRNEALADGRYRLRVEGTDASGNAAARTGSISYEIGFEVVNKSTISHVFNYPNPFSSHTRFVYTLTGAQLPSKFQLHIFTISGKLIKVIDLLAMGEASIGRNMTNYAWDGTDEYGDRLANGVYLYRVVLEVPGQEVELDDQGVGNYFNNGFGKMYIMR